MPEHKHAEILRAIADGKEIQGRPVGDRDWRGLAYPLETVTQASTSRVSGPGNPTNWEFRVRPRPEVVRYKRFLRRTYFDGPFVVEITHAPGPFDLNIEKERDFVKWIDIDWQTVEV